MKTELERAKQQLSEGKTKMFTLEDEAVKLREAKRATKKGNLQAEEIVLDMKTELGMSEYTSKPSPITWV